MVKGISVNSLVSFQGFLFVLMIGGIAYENSFADSTSPPDCSAQALVLETNLIVSPGAHNSS